MTWEDLEKTYKIKFKLEDGTFRPVNEWLDDVWLQKNREDAIYLFKVIMYNGEELFKDILFHHK